MKKKVVNGVVKLDWNSDTFYRNGAKGPFVAASNAYETVNGSVNVVFYEGIVFTFAHGKDPYDNAEIKEEIKYFVKNQDEGAVFEDNDDYVFLGSVNDLDSTNLKYMGLEAFEDDIESRLSDLAYYWEVDETDVV